MSSTRAARPARKMTIWEKNLLGLTVDKVPSLLPGLLVALILAALSIWLSEFFGVTLLGFDKTPISPVMLAILLGLTLGALVPLPQVLKPGFNFAVLPAIIRVVRVVRV